MAATVPLTTLPAAPQAPKPALLDQPEAALRSWLAERGQPAMRARQIRRWGLQGRAASFDEMSDLPKGLRRELAESFDLFGTRVERHLESADGTHKLLLRTRDGHFIECVLIQEENRHTACVSTQVGCGMGCVFCASGLGGVVRNLTPAEILEQLVARQVEQRAARRFRRGHGCIVPGRAASGEGSAGVARHATGTLD